MQKLVKVVISFFAALIATAVQAGPITVNDGDTFAYDPAEEYLFTGSLSEANTIVTYGVDVDDDPVESFLFTVNAPAELYLYASVNTGPDFGGSAVLVPNVFSTVYAGTSFVFPVDGNVTPGQTQWLSVGLLDQVQLDAVNQFYDGSISVGGFMSGDESSYFEGGQSPGNGGGANPVPIPSTLPLLGLGVLGLLARRRRHAV